MISGYTDFYVTTYFRCFRLKSFKVYPLLAFRCNKEIVSRIILNYFVQHLVSGIILEVVLKVLPLGSTVN